ncbi:Ada metal-binding domain-containing protein [Pedobacter sp. Hv1]|uniref:Ada metal-binding domain-containing protein n=1 Tax=Pedobacter sp. Hv1 TaxID=1740090 RepID=UPI0006D8D117|nr:Ada metal-binding domain-containing protein [Pedobacter sp. Hv1]KQC01115.1 metal-binding protein [Pedobacter sp. Hv1]
MILHTDLGTAVFEVNRKLVKLIAQQQIQFAGNSRLKIYGTLNCTSGKRMKITNRVFFVSTNEALNLGYRPCGHCLRVDYKKWKDGSI